MRMRSLALALLCASALLVARADAATIVIVNNDDSAPFTMGQGDPRPGTITIPAVMMRKQAGDAVKTALAGAMTVTVHLQSVQGNNDSSLDGTIVVDAGKVID